MIITFKEFSYIKRQPVGSKFVLQVDFGLRKIEAERISAANAVLGGAISLDLTEKVKEKFCYQLDSKGFEKIAFFSEQTNRFYKLTPTSDWPTLSIGSVPMHRVQSPCRDTRDKISFLKPYGQVLDTCMGLGYTAICASRLAVKVITFEKDENVFYLARINPLSEKLFSSGNIEVRNKDIFEGIEQFGEDSFDCIIHDPPTFKLAPQLFSVDFYRRLFRVLKNKGRLFHYTPLYKIKRGYDFPSKIKGKLQESGFKIIGFSENACGLLCKKQINQ